MIRGLAVFDLDGTLLRGDTVCEVLAKPLGRINEMRQFEAFRTEREIEAGRVEMARWYQGYSPELLRDHLKDARWAPGAREAIGLLQEAGVEVAVASITWKFAVQWFASQLNVRNYLGTDIAAGGEIVHVWGRDKAAWLNRLAAQYGVPPHRTAAIGDSSGDLDMLRAAALRFFVGTSLVDDLDAVIYLPGADMRAVAEHILSEWKAA